MTTTTYTDLERSMGATMSRPAAVSAHCTRIGCGFSAEALSWQEAKDKLDAHEPDCPGSR